MVRRLPHQPGLLEPAGRPQVQGAGVVPRSHQLLGEELREHRVQAEPAQLARPVHRLQEQVACLDRLDLRLGISHPGDVRGHRRVEPQQDGNLPQEVQ
ncbi:hypothetical protein D9M68_604380 [compost metagenome]